MKLSLSIFGLVIGLVVLLDVVFKWSFVRGIWAAFQPGNPPDGNVECVGQGVVGLTSTVLAIMFIAGVALP